MATKFENSKNFLIIEMTPEEAVTRCNFGYVDKRKNAALLVCDNCNDMISLHDKVYYVAVLNRLLCKNCCDNFVRNFKHYEEDEAYEVKHYNYYANQVGL
jgi:hypothetical protein